MKKKKKGFTLTELIAAVVVMAVIVLIAVPSYRSIRKKILEQQYENTVSLIETSAAKYASEKKSNMTIVQELIDKGLMETDDGTNIYDPRTNEVLNCYLVEIKYEKGNYNAEFTNVKSNSCTIENEGKIIAKNKETGAVVTLEDNKWINYDLELSVDVSGIESTNINYRWISSYGHTSTEVSVSTDVKTVLKTTYNVEVITNEEQYRDKQDVKIDKELPIVEKVDISGGNDWSKGREVTIKASDQNGSGIAGYYLGLTSCDESSKYQSSNKFNVKDAELYDGEDYHLCIKDKAGNVKIHNDLIHLELADQEGPKCKIITENDEWTKNDVTIKLGCEDSISGCDPNYSTYERTITETTETSLQKWLIKDKAGNVTNCEEEVNVYVDKTAPSCGGVIGQSTTWTSSNRTLTQECSDGHSGCSGVTKTYSATTKTDTMTTTIKDAVGNTNNCSKTVNVYVDKTAPSCGDVTGQSTTWTSSNRTLTQGCLDEHSGCSGVTKTYSATTKTDTMTTTIKDAVGNTNNCSIPVNVYVDKTPPSCGAVTGQSTTWTSSNRTLTQKCLDEHSGCSGVTKTYSATKKTDTMKTTIKDAVGNTNNCSKTVNVYVDKTEPTISFGTNGSSIYAKNASTTVIVNDDHSGLKSINYGWSNSSTSTAASSTTTSGTTLSSTCDISQGDCYLYVKACDKVGKCSTKRTDAFKIDGVAPTLSSMTIKKVSSSDGERRRVTVKLNESGSGLITEPVYWYYRHLNYNCSNGWVELDKSGFNPTKLGVANTYASNFALNGSTDNILFVTVKLTDKAGNYKTYFKQCYYSSNTCVNRIASCSCNTNCAA